MRRTYISSTMTLGGVVAIVSLAALCAAMQMSRAPADDDSGQSPLHVAAAPGGMIHNGPLVAVVPFSQNAAGRVRYFYSFQPFMFSDTNGKWRVIVFLTINPPVSRQPRPPIEPKPWTRHRGPEANNAAFVKQLTAALSNFRDTSVWVIRMNHLSDLGEGGATQSPFGPGEVWGATTVPCGAPRLDVEANCFSKFLYAGLYPGRGNLYYYPQYQWFDKTFPGMWNGCNSETPGHAVAFLDPKGRIFYDHVDPCSLGENFGNPGAPTLKGVLAAFNAARTSEGFSPILETTHPAPALPFASWLESSLLRGKRKSP